MSFWSIFKKIGKWSGKGVAVLPYIVEAAVTVERLSSAKGTEKRVEALNLAMSLIKTFEGTIDKDVLNDGEVQSAVNAVFDAISALQNILAKKG